MFIMPIYLIKASASTIPQPPASRVSKETKLLAISVGDTSAVYFCCEPNTPGSHACTQMCITLEAVDPQTQTK